jgi:hypothetical protein
MRHNDKEKDNECLTPLPPAPKKRRATRYQTPPPKKSAELCYQSPLLPPCLWRSAFRTSEAPTLKNDLI